MSNSELVVDLDLHKHDGELHVRALIHNKGQQDLSQWSLKFDLPKSIRPLDGTQLVSHVGSHVTLVRGDHQPLLAGGTAELCFAGDAGMIQRLSDLPRGLYVTSGDPASHQPAILGDHNLQSIVTGQVIRATYGGVSRISAGGVESATPIDESARPAGGSHGIVPRPASIRDTEGVFAATGRLGYRACAEAMSAITWLSDKLPLQPHSGDADSAALRFEEDATMTREAYRLQIDPSGISIRAADGAGFFHGAASVLQMARSGSDQIRWSCCVIEDQPRFHFRGLMLDCARHFHEKETILRTLDLMAQLKLNRFHWHLTDDEGWRIEIQAFPRLTARGAWRGEGEVLEPQFGSGPDRYGGFYSRQDVQEVVDYAAARHIEVIPEIDIPGHSRAAIKSVPDLLVEEADTSQYCGAQLYTDNVLNPALPGTYQFLHTVLGEVCDLFPGEYVHVGADEVPEGVWEQSPLCRDFMAEQGYQNAHELQGHLLRDLQAYLASKGKKLMGWEEAVHGDKLDHTATVNAWGGIPIGTQLANAGYGVVACAAPYAYLDLAWDADPNESGYYWAGTCDLQLCYSYEPGTPELTEDGAARMIGVQAALWSELVRDQKELEYMLFPRLLAMAETAWTDAAHKSWDDFVARLPAQMARLDQQGIHHRPLDERS